MRITSVAIFFVVFILSINLKAQDTIRPIAVDTVTVIAIDTLDYPIENFIRPITTLKFVRSGARIRVDFMFRIAKHYPSNWRSFNSIGFDVSEIAFVNWNAGGTSSISGLFKGNFIRIRSDENSEWLNELVVRYGINKQDGIELRKSDDEFRFNSTYGYRKDVSSNWYFSSKFNFKTQFSNGFKYPDTNEPISKPFAPAYTFLGVGADYFVKETKFDFYISPLTMKNTLVLDQDLADQGAFGVTKATYDSNGNKITSGEKSRTELGFLVSNYYRKELWKNITMDNRVSLYTDYINNFGNFDVEWRLQFDLVVNKYVRGSIGMHLIYDDDVKTTEEVNGQEVQSGAKIQLKQSLGFGLAYNF